MLLNRKFVNFLTILCLTISLVSCGVNNNNEYPLSELIELDENNWRAMLNGEWMVEFFAPWCPACKSLAPTWEKFAVSAGNYKLHVAKIDVTKSPSLSGRFFVTALPTIYHVNNGEFRQYRGPRNGDSFLDYVKEKQWKKIEPLSAWKQPNSIHMSILSWFFKLSHYLKDINTRLHDDYGFPTWGSYALFAIATIFIGAVLGLFLVCVVDFLYPPKKFNRQSYSESKSNKDSDRNDNANNGIEDIAGDEIEDEEQENDDDEDAGDNENDDSTSEGEKNSGDDDDNSDEAPESEKKKKGNDDNLNKSDKSEKEINDKTSEIRERKNIKKDDEEITEN